jgi:phosphate transport system permease protein
VVYGLVGAKILAGIMLPFWNSINDNLSFLPFLGGTVRVNNLSLGALVLAIMILPIISAVTREVFSQVPIDERYAAFGLGATRWEVMRHVVIHRSRAGIIGGSMLGLGRALGETIAVLLVLGANSRLFFEPFNTSQTVAAQIAAAFKEASPEYIRALVALGVALFVLTLVVNVLSRLIVSRFGNITGDASI